MSERSTNLNAVDVWLQGRVDQYTYSTSAEEHGFSWSEGGFDTHLPVEVAAKGVDASRRYVLEQHIRKAESMASFYADLAVSLRKQLH